MATNLHPARTVAILGAGCAGTLLAAELRRRRFAGRVELFDVRTDFTREQRWCFWRRTQDGGLDLPIDTEWPAWQVTDNQRTVRRSAASHVYSHVHAPEFFRRFHGRLMEDRKVALHLDCQVLAVEEHDGGPSHVRTSRGDRLADVVIDARHEGTPAYQRATTNNPALLWQTFRCRVVELATPMLRPGGGNPHGFSRSGDGRGTRVCLRAAFHRKPRLGRSCGAGPRPGKCRKTGLHP